MSLNVFDLFDRHQSHIHSGYFLTFTVSDKLLHNFVRKSHFPQSFIARTERRRLIHLAKFLAHQSFDNAEIKKKKNSRNVLDLQTQHTKFCQRRNKYYKNLAFLVIYGLVRLARYNGKVYSRHLFSYVGFVITPMKWPKLIHKPLQP